MILTDRHLTAIAVPARDGVALCTDVVFPEQGDGPWPATLLRTPYGRVWELEHARWLARDGVAVVVQDVRGRFGSGGKFVLGGDERADGADTITWVAAQPWCDGRVALRGFSYRGFTQWHAAATAPDALVAAAPLMSPAWWRPLPFRSAAGPVQLATLAHWLPRQAAEDPTLPDERRPLLYSRALEFDQLLDRGGRIDIDKALAHPTLARRPLAEPWAVEGAEGFESMWRDVFSSAPPASLVDDGGPPESDCINAPTLQLAGWYDPSGADAFEMFRRVRRMNASLPHKLIVGPFGHGAPLAEFDAGADAWRFGIDVDHLWALEWFGLAKPSLRALAPITYFVLGPNEWRSSDAWPPPGVEYRTLAFADDEIARFTYDPNNPVPTRGGATLGMPTGPCWQDGLTGGARDDVVSFTFDALATAMCIVGPVTADVTFVSSAADTDVTVKLLDVFPDGRARNIADGIARARYTEGDRYHVHLGHIAYEVVAGHRLRVDVSSSNFPLYDANPNTGAPEGTDTDTVIAHQEVRASVIRIPVVGP